MGREDCLNKLLDPEVQKKLFGEREIPRKAVDALLKDIEQIKINTDRNADFGAYRSRVQEYIREETELLRNEKAQKAMNLRKMSDELTFLTQDAFKNDPIEGIISQMTTTRTLSNGGRASIQGAANKRARDYQNMIFGKLEEEGLLPLFTSGEMDFEIRKYVHAVAKGGELTGIPEEAQKIGRIVMAYNKMVFRDTRMAGVPVRDLLGYTAAQTHNKELLVTAGKSKWVGDVLQIFSGDKKGMLKTFGVNAGDEKQMGKILAEMYDHIVLGKRGKSIPKTDGEFEDTFKSLGHTRSTSDKLAETRLMRFDSPEAEQAYAKLYAGKNLAEIIHGTIANRAKDIALVDRLGTNPRATFYANLDRLADFHRKNNREDLAMKIIPNPAADGTKKYDGRIVALADTMFGNLEFPANEKLANLATGIRLVKSMALLGASGIKAVNNLAVGTMVLKTQTGQSFWEASGNTVANFVKTVNPKDRAKTAKLIRNFVADTQASFLATQSDFVEEGNAVNIGLTKALGKMLKWNGLEAMTEGMKGAHALSFMEEMASLSDIDFKQWDPRMQASFLSAGISEIDAHVLVRAQDTMDGRTFVVPERLRDLPPELYVKEAALKKMTPERYIRDLEIRAASLIESGQKQSSTSASVREKSAVVRDQAGTGLGEVQRFFYLFKGYIFDIYNTTHSMANSKPDLAMLERGKLMTQGINGGTLKERAMQKDWMTMAQFVTSSAMLAYVADTAVAMLNGNEVKDPRDPRTIIEAFQKSGAGGMYVDYVGSNYTKYKSSWIESAVGPVIQDVNDLQKIISGTVLGTENSRELIRMTTKLARRNTPFQNIPGIKRGVDYLHYKVIDDTLNPGSYERRKSQLKNAERGK